MVTMMQPSFAGGEISPSTYGRIDLVKYGTGAKKLRNFFVLAWGGAANRAGTKFVGEVADSTKAARNIPFQFNTTQTYVLEFSDQKMRVVKDGAYATESGKTITGITKANPAVVTATSHGFSNGDHVYISGVGGMTELNGRTFKVANKATNTFELQDLGGTNINSSSYTTYTSGGTAARIYTLTTPYLEADLFDITYVQSADVMTLTHPSYAPRDLTRTGHTSWTLTTTTFATATTAPTNVTATATVASATTFAYTYVVTAIDGTTGEESVASSSSTCSNDLAIAGNFNTITWTAVSGASNYYVYKNDAAGGIYSYIGTASSNSFVDRNIDADETRTPPQANNPFGSSSNYPSCAAYYQERRYYANTDNNPQTLFGSTTGHYKNFNKSFPTQDDDSVQFTLASRQANEIRHLVPLIDLLVLTSGGEFIANGGGQNEPVTPSSISILPQSYRGASKVQPLVIGNVALFIQEQGQIVRDLTYEFSQDGYVGDDLTVVARHLFEGYEIVDWCYAQVPYSVVWMVRSDGALLSLTYLREHQVWGFAKHDTEGYFESVAAISEGDETAVYAIVKRTVSGREVRYQERMQSRVIDDVRDAFFVDCGLSLDSPMAVDSITQADPVVVTTASAHGLSTGDVIDFGYLATTSYDAATGEWTEHEASNKRYEVWVNSSTEFELLDVNDGSNIDGTDWGAYNGSGYCREAVNTVSGLWHLEGKTVAILANGSVHPQETVTNGAVTLDEKFSRVHVGLPYAAELETLPLEIPLKAGTAQGVRKTIPYVTLRMEKSRGGYVGTDFDNLYEMKQATDVEIDQPIPLMTDDITINIDPEWKSNSTVCVRQTDPLPITVLSVIPEVQVGKH